VYLNTLNGRSLLLDFSRALDDSLTRFIKLSFIATSTLELSWYFVNTNLHLDNEDTRQQQKGENANRTKDNLPHREHRRTWTQPRSRHCSEKA